MTEHTPDEIKLANEIASTLRDWDAFPLYLTYARKFKERHLRNRLAKVMSIDQSKIKKSRGALFTHLINQDLLRDAPNRQDSQDLRYVWDKDEDDGSNSWD